MILDPFLFLKEFHETKWILLVAAHKGEVDFFLQKTKRSWIKYDFLSYKIFMDREAKVILLLTGEGYWKSLHALSSLIVVLHQNISLVYNLGFVGSMDSRSGLNHCVDIRTCYASPSPGYFEFQSFPLHLLQGEEAAKDLITCGYRVQNRTLHIPLKAYASLVDRELWGICYALKDFSIPLYSSKFVSDFANENACSFVREHSAQFSKILGKHVETKIIRIQNETSFKNSVTKDASDYASLFDFHFTFTTRAKFNRLSKILSSKNQIKKERFKDWFESKYNLHSLNIRTAKNEKAILKQILDVMEKDIETRLLAEFEDPTLYV